MFEKKWFCATFCAVCSIVYPETLPLPYSTLKEVRPFVDFGFYGNAEPLHELIAKHSVKSVIEVGVFIGKSAMDMAAQLPEDGVLYAVDHFLGSVEHQPGQGAWHPCQPYLYEQFLSNVIHAKLTHKMIPVRMASLEAARVLETTQPDLIYIDASHDTESVYKDLCAWFPLVDGRGILCGDDWLWDSVRAAVERFAKEEKLKIHTADSFWWLEE
ncbi:MAG: class I SAM-dependent methyltransferase [Chlamydiales bacterium]